MGFPGWQWHQLDHMQTICTLLQTDNQNVLLTAFCLLMPNKQCQSSEGRHTHQAQLLVIIITSGQVILRKCYNVGVFPKLHIVSPPPGR